MLRRFLQIAMVGLLSTGVVASAQTSGSGGGGAGEDDSLKQIFTGPSTTAFGPWQLVLAEGAASEITFQPDTTRLVVRTKEGSARLITSARNLVIVENQEGSVDITLPNGRKIQVKPTNVEIVGRAIADDPGQIQILILGLAVGTVSGDLPAAALVLNPLPPPRPEPTVAISPTLPSTPPTPAGLLRSLTHP